MNYDYLALLDLLYKESNILKIVDCYKDDYLDKFSDVYEDSLLKITYSNKWPGTSTNRKARIFTFNFDKLIYKKLQSIGYLIGATNNTYYSLDINSQFDLSFYKDNQCLCFTTTHENIIHLHNSLVKALNLVK